jgi:cyclopropane fatty-acyl-phospholipid synthase-like methyltransferase
MWRLSGITYITSAIATAWSFMSLSKYIEVSKRNMLPLKNYFNDNTVLEFGCGLGRNLIVVSNSIKNGDGIDVNSGFIKIAMCIQNRIGISNLKFYNYDVVHFPDIDKVDLIFENGGFERISPEMVKNYMMVLKEKYLKEQGLMILYFLTERAKNTEFTKRLGNSAYIF